MGSAQVATQYTYEFVHRHLLNGARNVLEIGCGNGDLAARLIQDGLDVIALDSDESCVVAARNAGVDAHVATWPAPSERTFDTVLFTRSLHHIHDLDGGVEAAVAALRPGGRLIVEDFRFELDSPRTTAWFMGLMRLFDTGGVFRNTNSLDVLEDKLDFGEHRHELHSSASIARSLRRHGNLHEEDAAYYFRYAEGEIADQLAEQLLRYELAMIEAGTIDPLGKRFVLTPST